VNVNVSVVVDGDGDGDGDVLGNDSSLAGTLRP